MCPDDGEEAPAALLAQARAALDGGDPVAAADLFRRALRQLPEAVASDSLLEARLGLARSLELAHQPAEAIEHFVRAREVADKLDHRLVLGVIAASLSQLFMTEGRWEQALAAATEARQLAKDRKDLRAELGALGVTGQVHRRRGDLDAALDAAMDGLALAQKLGILDEELAFLGDMSLLALRKGEHAEARRLAELGLERATHGDRPGVVPVFLGQLCHAARAQGDLEAARDFAGRGLEAAREQGDLREQAVFLQDLAGLAETAGDLDEAVATLQESLDQLEALGHRENLVLGYRRMAMLRTRAGDTVEALSCLGHALALSFGMDPQVFRDTFSLVFEVVAHPWGDGRFEDILQGLDHFTRALRACSDAAAAGDQAFFRDLDECLEVLSLLAESRGDPASPEAGEARGRAAEVDGRLETDLVGYLEAAFEKLEGAG